MGGNGSGGGSTPVEPKVPAKKPSPIRGIVAGLLVVAVSAVAYFVFFSGSEEPQKVEKSTKQERIKEVAPAAAPKAVEPVPEKPKKELPWWRRDTTNGLTEAQLNMVEEIVDRYLAALPKPAPPKHRGLLKAGAVLAVAVLFCTLVNLYNQLEAMRIQNESIQKWR